MPQTDYSALLQLFSPSAYALSSDHYGTIRYVFFGSPSQMWHYKQGIAP